MNRGRNKKQIMKTWKHLTALAVVATAGISFSARAQDQTTTIVQTQQPPPPAANYAEPYYRGSELSVDGFGTLSLGEWTINHLSGARVRHNGKLGAGAGVNFFFSKMVGIGGDAWSEDTTGRFIDNASGSLILRFPIGDSPFAPYVFGGGGYEFDHVPQGFGQFGGGIEIRFNPHVGIFADARYIVADKTDDWGVGRAGFRFSF